MRKRRWWLHWTFVIGTLGSLIFLIYVINQFLTDAQMSMGPTPIGGNTIDAMLLNKKDYYPPKDGKLRIAQVHVCLRIMEALDSLNRNHAPIDEVRYNVTAIMNTHLQTRASYTWSRNAILKALTKQPQSPADSANVVLIRMLRPRLARVQYVLTDSIDAELLF